jgi:hypothetical protein
MREAALDRFSQKLLNSDHKVETMRNILVSGIKGYKRRVARCHASGTDRQESSDGVASDRVAQDEHSIRR